MNSGILAAKESSPERSRSEPELELARSNLAEASITSALSPSRIHYLNADATFSWKLDSGNAKGAKVVVDNAVITLRPSFLQRNCEPV